MDTKTKKKLFADDDGDDYQEALEFKPGCTRTELALDALTFIFADVQFMGPLTAIYCHVDRGLTLGQTGVIMCLQYIFSVAAGPLSGHLFDKTRFKRLGLSMAFLLTAISYMFIATFDSFGELAFFFGLQSAISGMYIPGVNSIAIALVGAQGFPVRCTRNEMFRHGGVTLAGLMPIIVVPQFGFRAYFFVNMSLAVVGSLIVWLIDSSKLNKCDDEKTINQVATPYRHLNWKPIVMILVATALFHVGNAPMLPFMGEKIDDLSKNNETEINIPGLGKLDGTIGVSVGQLIAELGSIPVALGAGKLIRRQGWGRRRVALIGFAFVPIRGVLFSFVNTIPGLLFAQMLDCLGAAVSTVVTLTMMADVTESTGRFSTMQGSVAAAIGLGSAIGQVIAGSVSEVAGYGTMFLLLSVVSGFATLVIFLMTETKPELLNSNSSNTGSNSYSKTVDASEPLLGISEVTENPSFNTESF
eukprot:m.182840 g.182840  ORF g.182840 m.182840 type:complete len:472 (+) comp32136_c1_seq1:96-1511(+)